MFRSKAKPYVLGLKDKMSRGRSGVPKGLLRLLIFLSFGIMRYVHAAAHAPSPTPSNSAWAGSRRLSSTQGCVSSLQASVGWYIDAIIISINPLCGDLITYIETSETSDTIASGSSVYYDSTSNTIRYGSTTADDLLGAVTQIGNDEYITGIEWSLTNAYYGGKATFTLNTGQTISYEGENYETTDTQTWSATVGHQLIALDQSANGPHDVVEVSSTLELLPVATVSSTSLQPPGDFFTLLSGCSPADSSVLRLGDCLTSSWTGGIGSGANWSHADKVCMKTTPAEASTRDPGDVVEAFFGDSAFVRRLHAAFLTEYRLRSDQVPLVRLNRWDWHSPFALSPS